jgi:hypothetical protein
MDRFTQIDSDAISQDGKSTYCMVVNTFNGQGDDILTVTALPPPDGFKVRGKAIERLATYEHTGLTPEEINNLRAKIEQLRAEKEAAADIIAKLVCLCEVPQKDYNTVFRRLYIGGGDYMGSGYAFVDAYYRIWDEFVQTADDGLYQLIQSKIEKSSVQKEEI